MPLEWCLEGVSVRLQGAKPDREREVCICVNIWYEKTGQGRNIMNYLLLFAYRCCKTLGSSCDSCGSGTVNCSPWARSDIDNTVSYQLFFCYAFQAAPFGNLVFRWTLLSNGLTRLLGEISGMKWQFHLVDTENSDALKIVGTLYQIGQLYPSEKDREKNSRRLVMDGWQDFWAHFTSFRGNWEVLKPTEPTSGPDAWVAAWVLGEF